MSSIFWLRQDPKKEMWCRLWRENSCTFLYTGHIQITVINRGYEAFRRELAPLNHFSMLAIITQQQFQRNWLRAEVKLFSYSDYFFFTWLIVFRVTQACLWGYSGYQKPDYGQIQRRTRMRGLVWIFWLEQEFAVHVKVANVFHSCTGDTR